MVRVRESWKYSTVYQLFEANSTGGFDMKLNCLGCGHSINLSEEYEDYSGNIRCSSCSAILKVKLYSAKLSTIEFLHFAKPSTEETLGNRVLQN